VAIKLKPNEDLKGRWSVLMKVNYNIDYPYIGIDGKPVTRTKNEYPYSYDPFVVWEDNHGKSSVVYSDRLYQWDYEKYNKCCQKVWNNEGQYFSQRQPQDIEKFLTLYFNKPIKLTLIMEGCNVSNGYPYWIFGYEIK
jgi:hypothetical protein